LLLLRLGAAEIDGHRADRGVRADEVGERRRGAAELLERGAVAEVARADPAVLLGERQAEEAEGAHLLEDRVGDLVVVLDLLLDGLQATFDELAHRALEKDELFGKVEVHGPQPRPRRCGWRRYRVRRVRSSRERTPRPATVPRDARDRETFGAIAADSGMPRGRRRAASRSRAG